MLYTLQVLHTCSRDGKMYSRYCWYGPANYFYPKWYLFTYPNYDHKELAIKCILLRNKELLITKRVPTVSVQSITLGRDPL